MERTDPLCKAAAEITRPEHGDPAAGYRHNLFLFRLPPARAEGGVVFRLPPPPQQHDGVLRNRDAVRAAGIGQDAIRIPIEGRIAQRIDAGAGSADPAGAFRRTNRVRPDRVVYVNSAEGRFPAALLQKGW